MVRLEEVQVGAYSIERFAPLVGEMDVGALAEKAKSLHERLTGRVFWTVNSTAVGGGVAEMLRPLLAYARGMGIDARWLVVQGNEDFFRVTKRLHHALHGADGDGTRLGDAAREIYESTLRENAADLVPRVQPGDFVLLHDPQTAGLAQPLMEAGARVVWRCHIGHDQQNEEVERGWAFLFPYLKEVPTFVFSREAYVPSYCDHGKSVIIQPSIDAFSAKNQEMGENAMQAILTQVGLAQGEVAASAEPVFLREDGSPGRVERAADIMRLGSAPDLDATMVVQVSRWDPLKDHLGVMQGFAGMLEDHLHLDAHLVLAGPNVKGVADDPEGADVYAEVVEGWRALPHRIRRRVHLAMLPTADVEENAAIVNALQRHATVVVQKSLREGFGLTVTEAMWKGRAVLASAVGGIQDQIQDGVNGCLLVDPTDLNRFGEALYELLSNPARIDRLGEAARESVRSGYLGIRHIMQYTTLFQRLDEALIPD